MSISLPSVRAHLVLSLMLLGACSDSKKAAPSGGAGGSANGGAGGWTSAGLGGAGTGGGLGGAGAAGGTSDSGLFCSGGTPRMVVNGISTTPSVVGQIVPFDCCHAGKFVVTTSDFTQPIAVQWWVEAGASVMPPATVDLGGLPSGWGVRLFAGCNVTQAGCSGALDNFSTGFAGSLSVTYGDSSPGADMSLCMHFEEPSDKPGTYVHTLDLYVPYVSTSN